LDQPKGLSPSYFPVNFLFVLSSKTKASWHLNYFVWDLLLGREFAMTPNIVFHPYVGLRIAAIYNNFRSSSFGQTSIHIPPADPVSFIGKAKQKLKERFWGLGPRIGTDWNYKFKGDWSFLGNFAGSLLYGHYDIKEKTAVFDIVDTISVPLDCKALNHDDTLRMNLDCGLGLGWETWFRNNTVRLAPAFFFEGALWFDLNNFFTPLFNFSQNHGNLGLMGFTFNLQVDF